MCNTCSPGANVRLTSKADCRLGDLASAKKWPLRKDLQIYQNGKRRKRYPPRLTIKTHESWPKHICKYKPSKYISKQDWWCFRCGKCSEIFNPLSSGWWVFIPSIHGILLFANLRVLRIHVCHLSVNSYTTGIEFSCARASANIKDCSKSRLIWWMISNQKKDTTGRAHVRYPSLCYFVAP